MTPTHVVYMGGSQGYYVGQKPALRPGLPEDSDHRFATHDEAQKWADALNRRAAR
jgi:hypothetical protein